MKATVGIIRAYQRGISPYLPAACMFTPVCSQYALDSIRRHGTFKGILLTAWRILRCNPLGRCGIDPTPAPGMWTNPKPVTGRDTESPEFAHTH